MTTETHGSLSDRATTPHNLEADEISFAISRFLPKAETSEEFAYICVLEARYFNSPAGGGAGRVESQPTRTMGDAVNARRDQRFYCRPCKDAWWRRHGGVRRV